MDAAVLAGADVLSLHVVQHAFAGVFNQVEYMLKALIAAMVGIGHHGAAHFAAKLGHSVEFVALCGWAQRLGAGHVFMVHHQHQVMALKVISGELPCAQIAQVIAAQQSMLLAAAIGCFTHMVGVGAA